MDLASLVGLLGAFAIIGITMYLGGGVALFFNVHAFAIVFVGSFFIVMSKFTIQQFVGIMGVAVNAFRHRSVNNEDLIQEAIHIADAARKGGLLSLESIEVSHPFMEKGIQMLVDGHDSEVLQKALKKDMDVTTERHNLGIRFFQAIGELGPAMGMVGTLLGLVQMLSSMEDPKAIGPAMAIALLATLYGAVLSNMLAFPIADKLRLRADEERMNQSLILDALNGIQAGQNPRVIEEVLNKYLPTGSRHAKQKK